MPSVQLIINGQVSIVIVAKNTTYQQYLNKIE